MLLVKRKVDERVKIGPDIEVMVISVGASGVTLGVEAPDELAVRRHGPPEGRGERPGDRRHPAPARRSSGQRSGSA